MAEVTVVVPTRDRRSLLERCLTTVLGQTGVDFEVVVVDDGSRDGTSAWLDALVDRRIRVIRHAAPRGVSAARNAGVEAAESPWIAFVDDDDLWAPTKLAQQLDAVRACRTASWVCTGEVTLNRKLQIVNTESPPAPERTLRSLLTGNTIPGGGSGVLASTALVRELGGFDCELSLLADWDLWIRLARRALPTGVDHPLVGYVRHADNMSWDVSHIGEELEVLDRKHRDVCGDVGIVRDGDLWSSWIGDAQRRAGRRWGAIRADLHTAWAGRTPKPLFRVGVTAVSPGAWIDLHERLTSRRVPSEWRDEAEAWLAPIRAASTSNGAAGSSVRAVGARRSPRS